MGNKDYCKHIGPITQIITALSLHRHKKPSRLPAQGEIHELDFLIIWAPTMDDWARECDPNFDAGQNTLIHGGKLLSDVKTTI